MSAMEQMLANMLSKMLPPEVLAMLSPDKMKELGERAEAFISNLNTSLADIQAEQLAQRAILEGIANATPTLVKEPAPVVRPGKRERSSSGDGGNTGDASGT